MKISRIIHISKILIGLCAIRQKIRIKTTFADIVYSILIVKKSSKIMKKMFLKINSKQSVNLRSGLIKFKNYFIQLAVPFKIYAVFKSALKGV